MYKSYDHFKEVLAKSTGKSEKGLWSDENMKIGDKLFDKKYVEGRPQDFYVKFVSKDGNTVINIEYAGSPLPFKLKYFEVE